MTEVEMVKWAGLDETLIDDERIKKLIWIAQKEARTEVWAMISETTKQNHDIEACESYPGGFFQKRHPSPAYSDDKTYAPGGFGLVKNDQKK